MLSKVVLQTISRKILYVNPVEILLIHFATDVTTAQHVRFVIQDFMQLIKVAYHVKLKTNFVLSVIVKVVQNALLAFLFLMVFAHHAK